MKKETETAIEKIGVLFCKSGFQPAVGRIFGYLLVAEPPQKTFAEIQNDLKLSKSAVSNALSMLTMMKGIDYITQAGDRKRYFRVNAEGWITAMKEQIQTNCFELILQNALAARSKKYPEFNQKLTEILKFNLFLNKEIAAALDKWERKNK